METPIIPTVFPIQDSSFVTVPSQAWKELCGIINNLVNVVNAQTVALGEQSTKLKECEEDISKLAKITEEIYENLA